MTYTINEDARSEPAKLVRISQRSEHGFSDSEFAVLPVRATEVYRRRNQRLPRLALRSATRIFDVYEGRSRKIYSYSAAKRANEFHMLSSLNLLMGLDKEQWSELRGQTSELLKATIRRFKAIRG